MKLTKEDIKYELKTLLFQKTLAKRLTLGMAMMVSGAIILVSAMLFIASSIQLKYSTLSHHQAVVIEYTRISIIIIIAGIMISCLGYVINWWAGRKFEKMINIIAKQRKIKL